MEEKEGKKIPRKTTKLGGDGTDVDMNALKKNMLIYNYL